MNKIIIKDFSIFFLYFFIFVLLICILLMDYPNDSSFGAYWYWKGLLFALYGLFLVFDSLKEKINYISQFDSKISIQYSKLLRKQILEINKNDIQNCTIYIYRNYIKLNIILNNGETFNINHRIVTPITIEKISKISDFTDKFDYAICTADFPNNAKIFEKIIKKDKKVILQQRFYSYIFVISFAIITTIIAMCAIIH